MGNLDNNKSKIMKNIKNLLVLALILLIPPPAQAEYRLVWGDEFNYSGSPDPEKWSFEGGMLRSEEEQYYTSRLENANVDGNNLIISARNEAYGGANYTSASLLTRGKETFTFGKIEIRAKLPIAGGSWPAFWTTGDNYSTVGWPACGEIDIFEFIGDGSVSGDIHAHVHYDSGGHVSGGDSTYVKDVSLFHIYAIEWDTDKIIFSVDDFVYYTFFIGAEDEFRAPHILRLNLALGGTWGGVIDYSIPVREYVVDYVRAYKDLKGNIQATQVIINSLLLK